MKKISLIIALAASLGSMVAQPLQLEMFNTAAMPPSYTTYRAYGAQDVSWWVAQTPYQTVNTPPAGGYVRAVSQNAASISGWYNPHFPTTIANAGWITYPNTCNSIPAWHGCLGHPSALWHVDQWYKISFYSCCEDFCVDLNMWADDSITEVYVNTNSNTPGSPGYWSLSPGQVTGYRRWDSIRNQFCDNFKAGKNEIIIHVVSNWTNKNQDYAGLLVQARSITACNGFIYDTLSIAGANPQRMSSVENQYSVISETTTDNLSNQCPHMIKKNPDGTSIVNSDAVINELLNKIETQQSEISVMKGEELANSGSVNLTDGVILNQNVPNPFAESTSISFTIPKSVSSAQLVFSLDNGTVVKTVDVKQRGRASITVYANDLSTGTYFYKLVVDGQSSEVKRMIKQ